MTRPPRLPAKLILGIAALLGCNNTSSEPPPTVAPAADSRAEGTEHVQGVVKVAVMSDGTVYVNSEIVPIDSLGSKLDSLGDVQEAWYHREDPEAEQPHENAMKVIAELANRRYRIAMYADREFTNRVDLGGQ